MVKQRSDEPDDKALERLRQFEQERKPVPENVSKDDKKKKEENKADKPKDKPDTATDL
jgi:hypothetical protein